MSPADAAKVLTFAAVYDNRTFDEPTCRVWAETLDGLALDDCLEAVKLHYRKSRQWIMPADVRELARSVIRDRLELERRRVDRLAVEAANVDPRVVAERAEMVRQAAKDACRVPDREGPSPHPKQDRARDRKARSVECPWCKAAVKVACVNTSTGGRASVTHEKRLIAAGLVAAGQAREEVAG